MGANVFQSFETSGNGDISPEKIKEMELNHQLDCLNTSILNQYIQSLALELEIDEQEAISYIYQNVEKLSISETIGQDIYSLLCQYKFQNTPLPENCGTNWSVSEYQEYLNSEQGQKQQQICREYGMDPHLLFALEKVESGLNHESHIGTYDVNGKYLYAVGITQQERTNFYSSNASQEEIESKQNRTCYNYVTHQVDSIPMQEWLLDDFEMNVRLGTMGLTNALITSNYDVSYALDIYNKGKAGADNFRTAEIVSGNPNYVEAVMKNIVVPYLSFQISEEEMIVIDITTGRKYSCHISKQQKEMQDILNTFVSIKQQIENLEINQKQEKSLKLTR